MVLKKTECGVSETIAIIILTATAIVLAIAVAFWVFRLAAVYTGPIELIIHPVSLNPTNNTLILIIYNSGSSKAMLIGIHIGNYTCLANDPKNFIIVPSGKNVELTMVFVGYEDVINNNYIWQCTGNVKFMTNVQYVGQIFVDNGYQFLFTVSS